jgi:hypothetical protein
MDIERYLANQALDSSSWLADRIGGTVLLLIPFVGPLLYWFVYNSIAPQPQHLQARGARGTYTHKWLAIRPVLEQGLRERREHNETTEHRDSLK